MIEVVNINWEQFRWIFFDVFKDVKEFLKTSEYSLSMRCPDWCLRIDHDRGFFIFDYRGKRELDIETPSGPYLFQVEGCPFLK